MTSCDDVIKVIFGPKSSQKNKVYHFYHFSKEVSPKIRAVRAITFHDASANADQKFIAPPKRHFFEKIADSEKKKIPKKFSASKKEKLQIVQNAFCQSFTPIRALFGG